MCFVCVQYSFIHSVYISVEPLQVHYYTEALSITARILCQSEHAEALQATTCEGLAHGPYVAAIVGFEPATFQTQLTKLATEPPRPTFLIVLIKRVKLS